jgi:hypothetical protein
MDKTFQVFGQGLEMLPHNQVVPVVVNYDPTTGPQVKGG